MPTLRQLQFLVAIAETGSFSAGAERACVTQPTLSSAIKELEDLLGVQLLERGRSGASLTSAGEEAAARAGRIIAEAEDLVHSVRGAGAPLTGAFKLGAIPTIAPFLLPQVLPAIRADWPLLKLYLREDLTARLLESVRMRRLDAALIALPFEAPGIESLPLFDDELLFVAPRLHPLAREGALTHDRLLRETVLLLEDGHCLRDHALAACSRSELRASAAMIGTSLHTLVQLVDNDLGLTMLPEMALKAGILAGTQVVARPVDSPTAKREIVLAWRKNSPREADFQLLAEELRAG